MGTSSSTRWGNRLVAWSGLIVGVGVVLPPLLRLGQEGWTGPNIFFLAAGTILACVWAFRLIFLSQTKHHRNRNAAKKRESP